MQKILESKSSIYYFWAGCALGGLILGGVIGKFGFDTGPVRAIDNISSPIPMATKSPIVLLDQPTTILFTGDVMLGRSVNKSMVELGDPLWPFVNVAPVLRGADITYINLEGPMLANCPVTNEGMKFCSDSKNVAGLVESGIDIASLANNHMGNYGQEGVGETMAVLTNSGIQVTGTGQPINIKKNRYAYSFQSYNDVGRFPGISQADGETMIANITASAALDQLVIVGFHWGLEYQKEPTSRQKELAHAAIDAGADLVIGSHPHWVQTKEIYKDKLIYYSLGNFIFDQEWSQETKSGLVVRLTYLKGELTKVEELPVYIEKYGQPSWQ